MTCTMGHDPYEDVCEDCDVCLGCNGHANECPTLQEDMRIAAREQAARDGEGTPGCFGCHNGCSFCEADA